MKANELNEIVKNGKTGNNICLVSVTSPRVEADLMEHHGDNDYDECSLV